MFLVLNKASPRLMIFNWVSTILHDTNIVQKESEHELSSVSWGQSQLPFRCLILFQPGFFLRFMKALYPAKAQIYRSYLTHSLCSITETCSNHYELLFANLSAHFRAFSSEKRNSWRINAKKAALNVFNEATLEKDANLSLQCLKSFVFVKKHSRFI